jgi:hypothetical protein
MPWYERRRCRFEVMPDGLGRPSRIYVELTDKGASLLLPKQIGRLFFGIRENVTWEEAEALADTLSNSVDLLCIHHLAAGEE